MVWAWSAWEDHASGETGSSSDATFWHITSVLNTAAHQRDGPDCEASGQCAADRELGDDVTSWNITGPLRGPAPVAVTPARGVTSDELVRLHGLAGHRGQRHGRGSW
jgi:hypothetical protein